MSLDAAVAKLVERLEAVTARLESVEAQLVGGASAAPAAGSSSSSSGAAAGAGAGAPWVSEFDELVVDTIAKYVAATEKIGNAELKAQAGFVDQAVKAHRAFLNIASKAKKPAKPETLVALLKPTSDAITKVIETRDKARGNALWNHLSAVSEAIPALGWVTIEPTPGPFADQFRGNSEFYTNKLLREYKGKDNDQVAWIEGLNGFLKGLVAYIKKNHTTELKWNARGGNAEDFIGEASGGAAAPAAPAAPAPPAAGPPPPAGGPPPAAAKPAADFNALFSEISKGTAVTSGLKKVTKEMKTKNQEGKSSVVPASAGPKAAAKPAAGAAAKKGPAKLELQGNKWVVENFDNNKELKIADPETKHVVYIYKTDNSVVHISGKVNAITIDNCKKTGIVFDSAIATVEVVNCSGVEVQTQGKVPSFAVDKSSGISIYLSEACLEAELVTSKSDSINVLIPSKGEIVELAVPEQYKSVIRDGALVTTIIEHV